MRDSALRHATSGDKAQDPAADLYAQAIAWRAIGQAYGIGVKSLKATFEECVQSVMERPGFEPRGGRTPEESAAAICATKPGGPREGEGGGGSKSVIAGSNRGMGSVPRGCSADARAIRQVPRRTSARGSFGA